MRSYVVRFRIRGQGDQLLTVRAEDVSDALHIACVKMYGAGHTAPECVIVDIDPVETGVVPSVSVEAPS